MVGRPKPKIVRHAKPMTFAGKNASIFVNRLSPEKRRANMHKTLSFLDKKASRGGTVVSKNRLGVIDSAQVFAYNKPIRMDYFDSKTGNRIYSKQKKPVVSNPIVPLKSKKKMSEKIRWANRRRLRALFS